MTPTVETESYLERVCQRAPVVARTTGDRGHLSVWDLTAAGMATVRRPYQARRDLCEALVQYAAPLLGHPDALAAAAEFERMPVALTANHHGVDFFAQSVQSTLLFALARAERGHATVPVFAVGSVALNNVTYPRGLLVYGVAPRGPCSGPERIPLFPSRLNRTMVSAAGPVEAGMIDRAVERVRELGRVGAVSSAVGGVVETILRQDYPTAPKPWTYARQAVVVNRRVWRRLFRGASPRLVYLELEELVARILQRDLENPRSLAWRVMFDRDVRASLVETLEGQRGCWEGGKPGRRLEDGTAGGDEVRVAGRGSLFFWGVDERGRRVALWLDERTGPGVLRGATDAREPWAVPFEPSTLAEGLRARRLLPSLFTCFVATALARGVTCLGGYYQAEYLPAMQAAVASALETSGRDVEVAALVREVPTSGYLSGMQTVMTPIDGVGLVPAGPAEIAAAGGLGSSERQRMLEMTVLDAHVASLVDTVGDSAPDVVAVGWREALAREAATQLSDKVVLV